MSEHTLGDVLVSAQDVSLKFGEKLILRPTSIVVHDILRPGCVQGQVVGILGPSGVGKTQFARILAGLQEPTTGNVLVSVLHGERGYELVGTRPGRVGMVFQNYPLFRHRTVLGNLLVALETSPLSEIARRDRVLGLLGNFGLYDKQQSYPAELSGGQRQRVAIIQQLLSSEHFLVMDEPFTGLDPLMKDKVAELINQVATLHERNTLFIVAHDIAALVSVSDTLWLFGRERDAQGAVIPGATIKKRYDLIERGLAWRPDLGTSRQFADCVAEIRAEFAAL